MILKNTNSFMIKKNLLFQNPIRQFALYVNLLLILMIDVLLDKTIKIDFIILNI